MPRRLAVVASTLLLGSTLSGSGLAADDPDSAVLDLLEVISARQLDDLDGRVCAEQQEAVREAFGDAALGLDLLSQSFGSMRVAIDEPVVDIAQVDEASASASVTAILTIEVDEAQMRDFVRQLIDASAGPDDDPATDEDIDLALPLVATELALEQPIDSDVTLVREGDAWVVCGGLGLGGEASERVPPAVSIATDEGLCGLATPAELSALSSLTYDSSTGVAESCTYSLSDWDAYHSATVSVIFDAALDDWRTAFPPDAEIKVAGAPAFISGPTVFTKAGDDLLQVSVTLPRETPPEDVDAATQARRISKLFRPRLKDFTEVETGSSVEAARRATPGPSLCDGLSLGELNAASGRAFDEVEGDPWVCTWSSSDADAGIDVVEATVTDLSLDEFRELLGQTILDEIDGVPMLSTPTQAVVELPDGRTLDVSVYYDEGVEPIVPAHLLATTVAGWLAPKVPAEPGAAGAAIAAGVLADRGWVDGACEIVPYKQLSQISGLSFDDPGFDSEFCEYYGGDGASGWHVAYVSLEPRPIAAWLDDYPEGLLVEVDGVPGMLARDILPDHGASALLAVEVPGHDELTLSAVIGIDTSTGTEVDVAAVVREMAELGLSRLLDPED